MEYNGNFGEYLFKLRMSARFSLSELGKLVGISANYAGELERGQKLPSDEVVRKIAQAYNLKEEGLFVKLNRVPLAIKEEVEKSEELKLLLKEISQNKNLSEETKEKLYRKVRIYYETLIDEI